MVVLSSFGWGLGEGWCGWRRQERWRSAVLAAPAAPGLSQYQQLVGMPRIGSMNHAFS